MEMSGAGRVAEEDQCYIPVKSRRGRKSLQKVQQEGDLTNGSRVEKSGGSTKSTIYPDAAEECQIYCSNLDRFIGSTTPSLFAQSFSKTTMRTWRTCDVEYKYYFTLDALWESFREWSAYGAGVQLALDGSYSDVFQYYVPYLSAIQLYGECSTAEGDCSLVALSFTSVTLSEMEDSKVFAYVSELRERDGNSFSCARRFGEDSDGDDSVVSGSNESSDYEIEEGLDFSSLQQTCQLMMSKVSASETSLSSMDKDNTSQQGFSSDDSEAGNSRGQLLFEFFEQESPYCREPLFGKIEELARLFPGLKTLRSCDLLPFSWFSVAWYPICRIPTSPTLKDLDACFLTYHRLSAPLKGIGGPQSPALVFTNGVEEIPRFVLDPFGLAVYKFKGSIWSQHKVSGKESSRGKSLIWAADKWMKLVGVSHPDFEFFSSRGQS